MIPQGYVLKTRGPVSVLVLEDLAATVESKRIFESGDPMEWEGFSGTLKGGRAQPVRIDIKPGLSMIVKALLRGGLMRPVNKDLHITASRLFQEAKLSNYLVERKVPITRMLLGRAERRFPFLYQLHLGFEEARETRSLIDLLTAAGVPMAEKKEALHNAGEAVSRMHDAGVFHHDLNFGNLLYAGRKRVWIIDFDRSTIYPDLTTKKRAANLARLFRHAVKNGFPEQMDFQEIWSCFLEGYCKDTRLLGSLEKEVTRIYRRTLPFHRLSWRLQGR